MKRALFVTTHPVVGGAQKWTYDQIALLQNSFKVYLATGSKGWLADKSDTLCEKIFIDKGIYAFSSLGYLFRLRQFVKENKIDIIIASSANAGIYSRLLKVLLPSVSVVYVSHGWSSIYRGNRFYQLVENGLSYLSSSILVISQSDYDNAIDVLKISSNKLKLIENGILPSIDIESRFNKPSNSRIEVVMIARFEVPKRQDLLIEVARKMGHIHFHFIGEGNDLESLRKEAPLNTTFWGTLTNVYKVLQQADIFILLSDSEGMPLAILEALSCSKPLLLSNIPSMHSFIDKNGLLVDNDVEVIIGALHAMETMNLKEMGSISGDIFNRRFNLELKKKEYLEYYMDLVS